MEIKMSPKQYSLYCVTNKVLSGIHKTNETLTIFGTPG